VQFAWLPRVWAQGLSVWIVVESGVLLLLAAIELLVAPRVRMGMRSATVSLDVSTTSALDRATKVLRRLSPNREPSRDARAAWTGGPVGRWVSTQVIRIQALPEEADETTLEVSSWSRDLAFFTGKANQRNVDAVVDALSRSDSDPSEPLPP